MAEKVDCIIKSGIVEEISNQYIHVRIHNESACSMCYSKGVCTSLGSGERIIDVEPDPSRKVAVGDTVDIQMISSSAWTAILLGYIIPFILLMGTLLIVNSLAGEAIAAISALLILAPYFLILYTVRNRMRRYFRFTLN